MSLPVALDNGHSNSVDFFTPIEGESEEDVFAVVLKMWESYKSIPAGLGGVVLRSTDGNSLVIYQMWVRDTSLGEFHEQLSSAMESVEAIAEINPNFFEPVVAESKQEGVKHAFDKDSVYGIQVFAIEMERWDSVLEECHGAMRKVLGSVNGPEWFIILRSWDSAKFMLLTRWNGSVEASSKEMMVSLVDTSLADPRFGAQKEIDNTYKVVEV